MKNYFELETSSIVSRAFVIIILFYVVVLSTFPVYHLPAVFNHPSDIFHEGEMLGNVWHMLAYYKGEASFPTFIHGGMDYWPSLIAQSSFGDNHVIYGTRLIVVFATLISWLLFMNLGISLLIKAGGKLIHHLLFIGVFSLTIPDSGFSVLAIEESPVGLRDVIILCQAYLLFKYYDSSDAIRKHYLTFMFILQPFGMYWAYDRGIASSLGCVAVILLLMKQRKITELLTVFIAMVLSFGLLEVTRIGGTFSENLHNIFYWAKHSTEIWGLPFHYGLKSSVLLLPVFSLLLLGVYVFKQRTAISTNKMIFLVFLFFTELLLLKSGFNRPNLHRVLMSSWPSVLILLSIVDVKPKQHPVSKAASISLNSIQNIRYLALLFLMIPLVDFKVTNSLSQMKDFVSMTASPPIDSYLAGEKIIKAAKRLDGQSCSVDWINQGVITLMSKTKHCTKFPYLIYASKSEQNDLIEEIQNSRPTSVIIDSNDWSSSIDGRSMKSRLPAMYDYFIKNYSQSPSVENYTLLTIKAP